MRERGAETGRRGITPQGLTAHQKLNPNVVVAFSVATRWRPLMTARTTSSPMHIGRLAEGTALSLRIFRDYENVGLLPT